MIDNKELILGIDVSSSCCGFTLMDLQGKLVKIFHIAPKLPKHLQNDLMEKANIIEFVLQEYKDLNIKHIAIEEPLLGSNNIFTIATLLKFNGIISYLTYKIFNVKPEYISVYNARKMFFPEFVVEEKGKKILRFPKDVDKKELVFSKVTYLEPSIDVIYSKFFKIKKENYDRSDSYVVAKAGLILNNYIPSLEPITEYFK